MKGYQLFDVIIYKHKEKPNSSYLEMKLRWMLLVFCNSGEIGMGLINSQCNIYCLGATGKK